jgi:hypothetical protein
MSKGGYDFHRHYEGTVVAVVVYVVGGAALLCWVWLT